MITKLFCLFLLSTGLCIAGKSPERISLFNGKDLNGWDGDRKWWTVEDGILTAESTPKTPCNTTNYLVWTGAQPSDFVLECDFKISDNGNSGIHIRSERRPNHDMYGYQADITGDGKLIGFIYHHKRGLVAKRSEKVTITRDGDRQAKSIEDSADLLKHYRPGEWNQYRIVCKGDAITLYLNGAKMCNIVDLDPETKKEEGYIGLQMHRGDPMKIQFKNLFLTPTAPMRTIFSPAPSEK